MGAIAVFLLRISACRYSTVLVHPARIYVPPSSAGMNLQSPSSQPATAQPASVASGSSQHGASAGVLPSSQLVGPSGGCLIYHHYYYYFVIILLLLLLLWHLGVCRHTFLVGSGIYSDCHILLCCYLLFYQPDGGCLVCLLVRA